MHADPDSLKQLAEAREETLTRLVTAFERDPRIVAAWLSGSFGRGEADVWSGLDLHVAVKDEAYEAMLAAPLNLFALAGEPLLIQGGFPSDSVPGGMFWLVIYRGPVEIDWNIGPVSKAAKPVASHSLIEKRQIAEAAEPVRPHADAIAKKAQAQLEFFWAMAPIACKYAGRGHTRLAIEQSSLLRRAFAGLWHSANSPEHLDEPFHQNRPMEPALDALISRFSVNVTPLEALDVIESFCDEVERLHPVLAALGVRIPAAMPGELRKILGIARVAAANGGTNPWGGSRR